MDSSLEENEKLAPIVSIHSLNKTQILDKYRLGSCKYVNNAQLKLYTHLKGMNFHKKTNIEM